MPKETIRTPRLDDPFEIAVGWGRDTDVQLGIQTVGSISLFWQLTCGGTIDLPDDNRRTRRLAEIGAIIREHLGDGLVEPATSDENQWSNWIPDADAIKGPDPIEDPGRLRADAILAADVLNALDVATGAPSSIWGDLDRPGCNALIRLTRRARDQAFGRDE